MRDGTGATAFALASPGLVLGMLPLERVTGLTAVGGGGRTTDVIHTDATRVGSWKKFRVTCGL